MNKLDNAAGRVKSGLLKSKTVQEACQILITQGHVPPQISSHLALEAATKIPTSWGQMLRNSARAQHGAKAGGNNGQQ
jgi:hypothetical protein